MDIAYQEYAFGVWETLSIWNKEGTDGNAISKEYHGAAKKNTIGEKLTNINKLIEDNFDCSLIKSVRLLRSCKGGMILPHKDYLEFEKGFTRIHVVLDIDETCLNSENGIVYQMKAGEVWFLDGNMLHSATSVSQKGKLNLMIDFEPNIPLGDLFTRGGVLDIPLHQEPVVRDLALEDSIINAFLTLNKHSGSHQVKEIMAMLNHMCFKGKLPHTAFYDVLDSVFVHEVNEDNRQEYLAIKDVMIKSGHHE
ncbi:hypothetical protein CEG15_08420 [Vibrio anguillarum]|uniref:aspartyl/asparaginyl beta-hydroxylase domain-containing protein n=1 Tax=Vibrio anguillarum TaxID=55601 RepID=UPI000B5405CE|nr:hypothetical protein CEG15_08420 [Vibrio anguillarum]